MERLNVLYGTIVQWGILDFSFNCFSLSASREGVAFYPDDHLEYLHPKDTVYFPTTCLRRIIMFGILGFYAHPHWRYFLSTHDLIQSQYLDFKCMIKYSKEVLTEILWSNVPVINGKRHFVVTNVGEDAKKGGRKQAMIWTLVIWVKYCTRHRTTVFDRYRSRRFGHIASLLRLASIGVQNNCRKWRWISQRSGSRNEWALNFIFNDRSANRVARKNASSKVNVCNTFRGFPEENKARLHIKNVYYRHVSTIGKVPTRKLILSPTLNKEARHWIYRLWIWPFPAGKSRCFFHCKSPGYW